MPLTSCATGTPLSVDQCRAFELAEFFPVELNPYTVGVADVQAVLDAAVGAQVLESGLVQLGLDLVEPLGRGREGQVLDGADRLGERRVVVAREVEEPQQVLGPEVEEEVAGAVVVAVL